MNVFVIWVVFPIVISNAGSSILVNQPANLHVSPYL